MATRRTTLLIDNDLSEQAGKALGTSGIRETVEASLREAARRQTIKEFREALGTIKLDMTLEELLGLRREG